MSPPRLKAFASWVTLLDTGLIVSAAAIVILLGGQTRMEVEGARIILRTAPNSVIFAACGGLRVWLGRSLRLLPAIPIPSHGAIEVGRERSAASAPALLASEPLEGAEVRLYRIQSAARE
jgi:hypothetical protein